MCLVYCLVVFFWILTLIYSIETDQVSDGGGSTTVIIVVVVVVLVLIAVGVIAAFFIRKRNLVST